jgi:tetratricopeptide (TPR) repeat protein
MGQEQAKHLLQQGIAAARAGQADTARDLLRQAARLDPQNETTWMWLTSVAADTNERIFCLKRILEINPANERARQGLQSLGAQPEVSAESVAESGSVSAADQKVSVPSIDEQKYARLQHAADDFLRRYNPEPLDRLQIEWEHKRRGRYNEMGERRLRRVIMAVAAFVVVGLVVGAVVLVSQFDISLGGDEVAVRSTRVLSPTPTLEFTPTPGGATPTPFPVAMAVPATVIPPDLEQQGNAYTLKTPTEMYPPVNSFEEFVVNEAVNAYVIGDYETAVEILRSENERDPNCYPSVVYFEAFGLAALGDYQEANQLLNESYNIDPPRGYDSCKGSVLLLAGLSEVAYMQDNTSQVALNFAEEALAQDPRLVQASLIKGRVELARDQNQAAWQTLQAALNEHPADTNVLLLLAQVELAADEPASALEYIGQALFVEPVLREGLHLQAQVYLRLAEQSPAASQQRIQYYGLAVLSAQTLLLYYEGDPGGYLYLAQARLGEGNLDLAEEALTRILAVQGDLPDSADPVIDGARRLRGYLYYDQGRFEDAWDDLEPIAVTRTSVDVAIAETLVDIAFQLEDYVNAERWIETLVGADPDNAAYVLLKAKVRVGVCTYRADLPCQYDDMLDALSDSFIAGLRTDALRAEAYAYRAQARYHDTLESIAASDDEQEQAFRAALRDVEQALALREDALDHYYRGLLLEALDDPIPALEEYRWVLYWADQYDYPFDDNNFERHVADVADEVQEIIEAQATETPTPGPTRPRPTATRTPAPTATPRPTAEPTAVPPEEIP